MEMTFENDGKIENEEENRKCRKERNAKLYKKKLMH